MIHPFFINLQKPLQTFKLKKGYNELVQVLADGLLQEVFMVIAVIDGQGGGIGKALVEKLRKELGDGVKIIALGTNSAATTIMLKSGANEGATGENAIKYMAPKVDIIVGPIGIIVADSMLGELTPAMATAISSSPAHKVLIPLNRCNISVAGVMEDTLPSHIDNAVSIVKGIIKT